jgi:IS4 transposase
LNLSLAQADGAFSTDKILQRLENYEWPVVMRIQRNRKLSDSSVKTLIARGYVEAKGLLKNGVKIKIFRRKSRFFGCNRMLWAIKKAIALYKRRWSIEETFRTLKTHIGLKGCQQHSMRAQLCTFLSL